MPNNTVNPAPHPNVTQTTPFTPGEITDIRRFGGFPAYAGFGYVYGAGGMANLDVQIANMSDQEQVIIRTVYLPNLTQLESDVVATRSTLNVAVAAVFTRNKNEVAERRALFNSTRREMCAFIGVAPGPGLRDGNRIVRG